MSQEPSQADAHDSCKADAATCREMKTRLPDIAEAIIQGCEDAACYTHIDYELIPSREAVIEIVGKFREVLFPGYFSRERLDPLNLTYSLGKTVTELFDLLAEQVTHSIRHDCFRYERPCSHCVEQGYAVATAVLEQVPGLRRRLSRDVRATYEGDPAAGSTDEIIFSYPGLLALMIHRVAHMLQRQDVPLLPRIMSEYAHSVTGIDIHPSARIGDSFVIDHGTGVVIGQTAVVGDRVRIYQGVTLGALSLPRGAGERLRGQQRHPTIEDDVIIYSGATILGGDTVIGARSVIGGNVWLTESVPPDTTVVIETPRLNYRHRKPQAPPATAAAGGGS